MSIISIIFIFLVHNLLSFFKSTLTVPKIKDLVNSPNQKYQNIYDTISRRIETDTMTTANTTANTTTLDSKDPTVMKNELKSFLKKQMNKSTNDTNNNILSNDILGIDSMNYSYSNI